MKKWKLNR